MPASAVDWGLFPCAPGDVVVRASDGAEAWLEGALVLREDVPVAALFIAPDASGERAVYARPRPLHDVAWLVPVASATLLAGAEPPSVIEIDHVRFERVRRLPLRVERVGEGAPDVGATGLLGEYTSRRGEVAIVLVAAEVHVWRGTKLGTTEFDVWRGDETARGRVSREPST
jgi:hypothetical protein